MNRANRGVGFGVRNANWKVDQPSRHGYLARRLLGRRQDKQREKPPERQMSLSTFFSLLLGLGFLSDFAVRKRGWARPSFSRKRTPLASARQLGLREHS